MCRRCVVPADSQRHRVLVVVLSPNADCVSAIDKLDASAGRALPPLRYQINVLAIALASWKGRAAAGVVAAGFGAVADQRF